MEGPLRGRIDFFGEPDVDNPMRTPGACADEAVRLSFERCEVSGDYAEVFYNVFLAASPEIAPYFGGTDFSRQRQVLRDSVHMMVTRDVSDPEMRQMLDGLGKAHGREGRNVLPELYERWLERICEAVKKLDPDWDDDLERQWRVRLRAGMQIIMAAYWTDAVFKPPSSSDQKTGVIRWQIITNRLTPWRRTRIEPRGVCVSCGSFWSQ